MPQRIDIPGQGVVEFPDGMSDADIVVAIKRMSTPRRPDNAMDAGNAVGTGFFRGATRLAGLPVDTVANVIDLGKAAIGAPYTAMTGKTPQALEPLDRSQVVGSSEYLLNKVRQVPGGSLMVDPQNPAYEGGYLQNAGAAATALYRPNSLLQLGNQALLSQTGAAAGKATYDATGNEALAITAGMLPGAAQYGGTELVKRAVRGGEEGRQRMAQRTQDLKNAGVDNPTLGLSSGNRFLGGVENLLQNTPGAVGIMQRARTEAVEGMESAANRAASLASPNRGSIDAGRAIQKGGANFKQDFKAQQEALYNRLDQFIEGQAPVRVDATKQTLAELNSGIRGAPELSKQFQNGRLQSIEAAIGSDTSGAPASVQVYPQPPRAAGGIMNQPIDQPPLLVQTPAGPPRNTLPFEAVKKTRTLVGNEIADNSLLSDVPRSKWNPLYAALSNDMQGAATAAGPQAEGALNRANQYTRAGIGRMERIAPIVNRESPEGSFKALESTLRDNNSTFQAVKKSLPQDARGSFAGTIIERLGKASPGQQDAEGSRWSPETFLTNWNRIGPEAQRELLAGIPNAGQVKDLVDSVARGASMMRDNSKMWANPSGTGANVAARGVIGAIGAGGAGAAAGLLNPLVPIGAAVGVGGVNLAARALTSRNVREAMQRRTDIDPELLNSLLLQLQATGTGQPPTGQAR
jgi:hypothetical protein